MAKGQWKKVKSLFVSRRRILIFGYILLVIPAIGISQSTQFADSLFQRGRELNKTGNIREAQFYYRKSYHIYQKNQDTLSFLKAGLQFAKILVYRSKYEQATKFYEMLLEVNSADNLWYRSTIYNSMGWASKRKGKLDQAMNYYQQSLPLALKTHDSLLIGVVNDNIGGVYQKKGHYQKSLQYSKKALRFFKAHGSQKSIAKALNNRGYAYEKLLLFDKALKYYNKSLKIREQLGSVSMLSTIYDNIAGVQREMGNYDQALVGFEKSLNYSRKSGVPSSTARILNNIGLLYKNLGEYNKAFDYYQQSLSIKKQVSGAGAVATTTKNLGNLLWEQEKFKQAAPYFIKALEMRKRRGNPYSIASSLGAMVRLELKIGNMLQAQKYANNLQYIADSTGSAEILKKAFLASGKIQAREKNDRAALTHFKKAYGYARQLTLNDQLMPLRHIAKQFNKLKSDSAIFYGQKVINIIESQRANAGALPELKMGYFGRYADFYKELAAWVLTYKNDISHAFKLVELAKARSLSEELVKAAKKIKQKLPEDVRIEQNQKKQQIDSLYSKFEKSHSSQERSKIQEKIRMNELKYAAYANKLHLQYPEFNRFKSSQPVSLTKAGALNDTHTAVLEYAIHNKKLLIFLISSEQTHTKQILLSGENELTTRVTNFKKAILSGASRPQLDTISDSLYDVLIKPFQQELDSFDNLIIVPDGPLAYLPFEALTDDSKYLIERYNIKYEPSVTILSQLKNSQATNRRDLLAVAGSQLPQTITSPDSLSKQSLSMLPATMIEVDSISSHFEQATTLKNNEVTEKRLKRMLNANHYRYVHFATHGIIDEGKPKRSGLVLASAGNVNASSEEDGLLRSSEIFGLDLETDLVVLSACKTGLGKMVRGEGMLGLQRSFFYAGASTMAVSLWNVYDRATASFMNEFYKAMLREHDTGEAWTDRFWRWIGWSDAIPFGEKAIAMREAKLKMLHHPVYNHPVYWAPFIVVGR